MNLRVSLSPRVRVIGVGVAAVVVLVAGLVVVLAGGAGPPVVPLSAPPYVADPVPKLKEIGHWPAHCGVRAATVRRYVPGGRLDGGDCTYGWESSKSRIRLAVVVGPVRSDRPTDGPVSESTDGDALRLMNPADPQFVAVGRAARPVSGLGEEALYEYTPAEQEDDGLDPRDPGARVRFRVGADVVDVTATDGGEATGQVPPEKQARPAAFAAATDVARALHVPAKPVLSNPGTAGPPPPIAHPVRPCDLVPDDLANQLVPKGPPARPSMSGLTLASRGFPLSQDRLVPSYGEAVDACDWKEGDDYEGGKYRYLSVTVLTETNWRPGIAVPQATRQYLVLHDDARAKDARNFHAVRGLGDQAFAGHWPGDKLYSLIDTYQVMFRRRNQVVVVGYSGSGLTADQAFKGAYTAASRAQEALR